MGEKGGWGLGGFGICSHAHCSHPLFTLFTDLEAIWSENRVYPVALCQGLLCLCCCILKFLHKIPHTYFCTVTMTYGSLEEQEHEEDGSLILVRWFDQVRMVDRVWVSVHTVIVLRVVLRTLC